MAQGPPWTTAAAAAKVSPARCRARDNRSAALGRFSRRLGPAVAAVVDARAGASVRLGARRGGSLRLDAAGKGAAGWSGSQRPSQKSRVGGILVLARLDPAQFWEWSSKNSRGKSCSAAWLLSGSFGRPVDCPRARTGGPFLFSWLAGGKTLSATSRPDRFTALLITLPYYAGFVPGAPLPRSLLLEDYPRLSGPRLFSPASERRGYIFLGSFRRGLC